MMRRTAAASLLLAVASLAQAVNMPPVNAYLAKSSIPMASLDANRVYLIGARTNEQTLEALDCTSGKSDFHYVIGGQRFNVLFSGTLIDEGGRIHFTV